MLYKFISAFAGGGGIIKLSDIWPVIRIGAIGEFLGFVLAIGASISIRSKMPLDKMGSKRRLHYLSKASGFMTHKNKMPQRKNYLR